MSFYCAALLIPSHQVQAYHLIPGGVGRAMCSRVVSVATVHVQNADYFEIRGLPVNALTTIVEFAGDPGAMVQDGELRKYFRMIFPIFSNLREVSYEHRWFPTGSVSISLRATKKKSRKRRHTRSVFLSTQTPNFCEPPANPWSYRAQGVNLLSAILSRCGFAQQMKRII